MTAPRTRTPTQARGRSLKARRWAVEGGRDLIGLGAFVAVQVGVIPHALGRKLG